MQIESQGLGSTTSIVAPKSSLIGAQQKGYHGKQAGKLASCVLQQDT